MSQNSVNKLNFNKKINPDDSDTINSVNSDGLSGIQTFQNSSRCMFLVSKLFGYTLFQLPKINFENHKICRQFKIKTTFIDISILVVVVAVYVFLIYHNSTLAVPLDQYDSLIIAVGGHICLIIGLIVSTAAILLCYVRRKLVFKIYLNLCYIDIVLERFYDNLVLAPLSNRIVKKLNINTEDKIPNILNHSQHFKVSILFLLMGLVVIGIDLVVTYALMEMDFVEFPLVYVSYVLQNASFLIITTQTVLFLLAIKTRFTALNKLICCYLTIQDDGNQSDVEELYDLENYSNNKTIFNSKKSDFVPNTLTLQRKIIAEFAQIHDKLNDIVEWINCCYAVQCLGVVAVSFGYVILMFFSLYYALFRNSHETVDRAITYLTWCMFYILCVLSLITAGWAVTNEGNTTGVLLHKSINQMIADPHLPDIQCKDIIDSLRIFSLQLQKRSPVVSCGLFIYDWTLLFSIISASATYLIILIQFDSSSSFSCNTNKTINATHK